MDTKRIIAFTGKAGSGKSEAAKYLVNNHGFSLVKFAGPLKAMLRAYYSELGLWGYQIDQRLEGDLKELPDSLLGGQSPRHAMQSLGTEWGRSMMHPEFWVDAWISTVEALNVPVVCDDLRMPNEAHAVHHLGGEIIQLTSQNHSRQVNPHSSETGLSPDLIDSYIFNEGSIASLHSSLDTAICEV